MTNRKFVVAGLLGVSLSIGCDGLLKNVDPEVLDAIAAVSSLDQLPSADSIVNSATEASRPSAVEGTPPNYVDLTLEPYFFADGFFDGLSASLESDRQGTQTDFFEGQGKCFVVQNNGFAFQNVSNNSNSLCYMREIPNAASGVTIDSGDVEDPTQIFAQGAETFTVNVQVSGMQEGGGAGGGESRSMNVYIKVYGQSEYADGYKMDMWFCGPGQTTPNGVEQVAVNRTTGAYTHHNLHADGGHTFAMDLTASLIEGENGRMAFDHSAPKYVEADGVGEWGSHHTIIEIDGSSLITRNRDTNTWQDHTWSNKQYTSATYAGTNFTDLRFSEASFSSVSAQDGGEEWSHMGAMEYQESAAVRYASVTAGALYDAAAAVDFSDSFFTDAVSDPDTSALEGYSCSPTVDRVVTMDFGDPGVDAVRQICEGNRFDRDMNLCFDDQVQTAQQLIFAPQ